MLLGWQLWSVSVASSAIPSGSPNDGSRARSATSPREYRGCRYAKAGLQTAERDPTWVLPSHLRFSASLPETRWRPAVSNGMPPGLVWWPAQSGGCTLLITSRVPCCNHEKQPEQQATFVMPHVHRHTLFVDARSARQPSRPTVGNTREACMDWQTSTRPPVWRGQISCGLPAETRPPST